MRRIKHLISFLILIALVWISFKSLLPPKNTDTATSLTAFSTERAMEQLKVVAKEPHYVGTEAHAQVRAYLVDQLTEMGLETSVQKGYVLDSWWGISTLVHAKNIVARIKGANSTKALLLISHYDSAPHSKSYGASDAGSGVVTVLEGLRAYLANNISPKNDIIIVFTDSEELGLDGATLFVNEHPWAKNVGVALNFEARGSSGPSNMIVETNGGNSHLIEEFTKANVKYPVATSLMYSIYKMLPNDTDSTVLRENGNIPGFFFAFIDSHFNYHTANDQWEQLDPLSLTHQGSYVLPLIKHFSQIDLSQLQSKEDRVYFDAPLFTFVSYPFTWVWPMVIIAVILFVILLFKGLVNRKLQYKAIGSGFVALILSLLAALLFIQICVWIWPHLYPQYADILPVFLYNGHWYTLAFVMISLAISFGIYNRFCKTVHTASAVVAPLFVWIIFNILIATYLKGAGYFIIPLYASLIAFYALVTQRKPSVLLMVLLAAPALLLFSPLVQFFPVGLGPKAYWISAVFTVLIFGLILPVFGFYRSKRKLSYLGLLLALVFLGIAHAKSDYTVAHKKPNSLLYYYNSNTNKAYWVTYDKLIDTWVGDYLGQQPKPAIKLIKDVSSSKYNTGFTYATEAPIVPLQKTLVYKERDTVINQDREVTLRIAPQREVNRIRLFAGNDTPFKSLTFNKKQYLPDSTKSFYKKRKSTSLLSYYMGKDEELEFSFTIPVGTTPNLSFRTYSFDLIEHPKLQVAARPETMMPKPFVVNDAIITEQDIDLNVLVPQVVQKDSLKIKPSL